MANFTVMAGENRLQRPVGGGKVESGALKGGEVVSTNLTMDTSGMEPGWIERGYDNMFIVS